MASLGLDAATAWVVISCHGTALAAAAGADGKGMVGGVVEPPETRLEFCGRRSRREAGGRVREISGWQLGCTRLT
jgi:hypothetical protein